ncbi:HEAT repeat domain-containing protein [Nostoc sp. XA010]|uniref:HEAT repeat domain-containing protein n=1 Tax=Nostoc sp. XA010 TaxID=2780407 RepID=UPI001E379E0F|nr:HEAT repeat domain-containing protein [Nostoc sp. XA010]MCC5661972.1 HEAT repeat domain-containing protein [Nostoc sp. XA010]
MALGNLAHPDVINPLQQALDDPDKEVSIQAQRAIQKIQRDRIVSREQYCCRCTT